ncbi:TadE/TadG family type IV pilus assembly protein [Agromyces sp. LHK192]|uniref:TadE/TadG family type IV pilus assembly protein n=1 Tax=Agromyces sp. LHK192 TaxID=2498704 RepID=UPI0021036CD1|nr:TadE/TadG family type IV pilus assembly protein [Agromyces sp. LHK192]
MSPRRDARFRVDLRLRDDRGSAVAEFSMVIMLLLALVLAVMQLALALHVRNTLLDTAAEGARFAALAGASDADGVQRTRELIDTALASSFAQDVSAVRTTVGGIPVVAVTVRATMPVIGLFGPENALEVTGHAALEVLE